MSTVRARIAYGGDDAARMQPELGISAWLTARVRTAVLRTCSATFNIYVEDQRAAEKTTSSSRATCAYPAPSDKKSALFFTKPRRTECSVHIVTMAVAPAALIVMPCPSAQSSITCAFAVPAEDQRNFATRDPVTPERDPDDLLQQHGAVSAAQRAVQQQPVEDGVVTSYDEHRNRQSPPSAETRLKRLREAASQAIRTPPPERPRIPFISQSSYLLKEQDFQFGWKVVLAEFRAKRRAVIDASELGKALSDAGMKKAPQRRAVVDCLVARGILTRTRDGYTSPSALAKATAAHNDIDSLQVVDNALVSGLDFFSALNLNDTGAGGTRAHTPPPAPAIGTLDCLDALDASEPIGALVISQFLTMGQATITADALLRALKKSGVEKKRCFASSMNSYVPDCSSRDEGR
jgi:hypothetical protein